MKCSCLIGLTSTASAFLAISLSAQCPLQSIILSSRWRCAVVAGLRRLTWRGIDMSNTTRSFLLPQCSFMAWGNSLAAVQGPS